MGARVREAVKDDLQTEDRNRSDPQRMMAGKSKDGSTKPCFGHELGLLAYGGFRADGGNWLEVGSPKLYRSSSDTRSPSVFPPAL
jgi:hypothetical protein